LVVQVRRRYPQQPVVAVGAVVLREGRILLARRGKKPHYGRWSLPGGVVRLGENLREAVKRELYEECSLEVEVEDAAEVVEQLIADEAGHVQYHYVIIDYLASWKRGELTLSQEVLEARWVTPGELARYDLTDGTLEVIQRLLAKAHVLGGSG